ncbi:MAG: SusC/RagA family TonB-linked outer membrane protein [Saprospiraceae bacterium]|nr:MAG: SusC/RagA family TonB-linked outer membrane protein [Saprospiraceae bacterium]
MKRLLLIFSLVLFTGALLIAQRTITGTLTDQKGEPLIGASVLVEGTSTGTITDFDGKYSLNVPDEATTLVFSYTGYTSQEIEIGVSSVIDVVLEEGITLETAVVTALGIEREKKSLTYSVEQVEGDELIKSREANIVNSLAGKFSGVQVTSSGGQAGSSSRVVIRGNSSFLGNNEPLFVIDGVPIDNSQTFGGGQNDSNGRGNGDSPLFYGGTSNRGVDIDPANVESLSVLKGASATALYGSRAANGVVLITTKSGIKNAKPQITLSSNYGFSEARLPEFQTKYSQGQNGTYFNGNNPGQLNSNSYGARIDTLRVDANGDYDPNGQPIRTYDNAKDFFRTGSNFDNSLSISGGGVNSNYYVSYSNKIEKGIIRNNDLDRHSFLAKFSNDFTDKLTISASINYTQTDLTTSTEGNGRESFMWTVYGAPVTYNMQGDGPGDYLNPDGTQRLYRTARNNPYFLVDNNNLSSKVNRFLPNLSVSYQFTPWLKLINRLGADVYTDQRLLRQVSGTLGSYPTGRVYEDDIKYLQINNDFLLQMNKRFDNFDLDVILGSQINDQRTDRLFTQGVELSIPNFFNLSNASTVSASQNLDHRRLIGLYATATVGYKNYLYLTATARNDWSSTLPVDARSFFYPSVSASFVVTDAIPSLQTSKVLSFLKFRLGYAQVGNDAPTYATQPDLYVQSSVGDGQRGNIISPYLGQNGFTVSNIIGNPSLKSELTNEIEAGVELFLFRNRIRFEGSYYNRLSEDQIFQAPIAASSGAVAQLVNAGSLRNKGFEILVEFTPVKVGGFQWTIGGTFSKNESTIEELTEGVENIRLGGFTSPGIYIVRNQGYGVIWGSQYNRNDDGQVIINDNPNSALYGLPATVNPSLGVIGSTLPDWIAGIKNGFSYTTDNFGSLGLKVLVDIREGGDILNLDNFYLNGYGVTKASEDRSGENSFVYPNGVLSDGTPNNIEVPYDETYWRFNWGRAQEEWVEDGSYVRLREVTLSYALPSSLLKGTFIQGLNLSVTGRNLYLNAPNFTGADPETSLYGSANAQGFYNFITPGTKGYNVALQVTF